MTTATVTTWCGDKDALVLPGALKVGVGNVHGLLEGGQHRGVLQRVHGYHSHKQREVAWVEDDKREGIDCLGVGEAKVDTRGGQHAGLCQGRLHINHVRLLAAGLEGEVGQDLRLAAALQAVPDLVAAQDLIHVPARQYRGPREGVELPAHLGHVVVVLRTHGRVEDNVANQDAIQRVCTHAAHNARVLLQHDARVCCGDAINRHAALRTDNVQRRRLRLAQLAHPLGHLNAVVVVQEQLPRKGGLKRDLLGLHVEHALCALVRHGHANRLVCRVQLDVAASLAFVWIHAHFKGGNVPRLQHKHQLACLTTKRK